MAWIAKKIRYILSLWADLEQTAPRWTDSLGYAWAVAVGIYSVIHDNVLAAMIGAPISGFFLLLAFRYYQHGRIQVASLDGRREISPGGASISPEEMESKLEDARIQFRAELDRRATESRAKIYQGNEIQWSKFAPRKKYALPKESDGINLSGETNQQLAERLSKLSKNIRGFAGSRLGNFREKDVLEEFTNLYLLQAFWLYDEAKKRFVSDQLLDNFYDDTGRIYGHKEIGQISDGLDAVSRKIRLLA